jgi:hypothetical protein
MSIDLNRRDFIKMVSGTVSAAAVASPNSVWPKDAQQRPVAEPFTLLVDESGYLVDPEWDPCEMMMLTNGQHHEIPCGTVKEQEAALRDHAWLFEHIHEDPDELTLDDVKEWLDAGVEPENLGAYEAATLGPYGPGIEIFEWFGRKDAEEVGLSLIEGCHPGSDFMGVMFSGDLDGLNQRLQENELNLVVLFEQNVTG